MIRKIIVSKNLLLLKSKKVIKGEKEEEIIMKMGYQLLSNMVNMVHILLRMERIIVFLRNIILKISRRDITNIIKEKDEYDCGKKKSFGGKGKKPSSDKEETCNSREKTF